MVCQQSSQTTREALQVLCRATSSRSWLRSRTCWLVMSFAAHCAAQVVALGMHLAAGRPAFIQHRINTKAVDCMQSAYASLCDSMMHSTCAHTSEVPKR